MPTAVKRIYDLIQEIEDLAFTSPGNAFDETEINNFLLRHVNNIGEATKELSDGFKISHPEIPWSYLAGMKEKFQIYPLVFKSGENSEWRKLVDYLLDLKEVCYYAKSDQH